MSNTYFMYVYTAAIQAVINPNSNSALLTPYFLEVDDAGEKANNNQILSM